MTNTLTASEKERYRICTKAVMVALEMSFDGGIALIEVRDQKLYREEYPTFEDYCSGVLKISKSRAYQLIEAAQIKDSLPAKVAAKITNERQARALADVPESIRPQIISEAGKNGSITAESINDAKSKMSTMVDKDQPIKPGKSSKPPDEFDDVETVIPEDALPFWHRRQEVQDILSQISKIKGVIERAKASGDPMYAKVSNAAIADLSKAYTHISEAKPYAVCTNCGGSPSAQPKGCEYCGNSGLVSKFRWDTASRSEVKEMRSKIVAARRV